MLKTMLFLREHKAAVDQVIKLRWSDLKLEAVNKSKTYRIEGNNQTMNILLTSMRRLHNYSIRKRHLGDEYSSRHSVACM